MSLTGQQRFRQVRLKARLINQRNIRRWLADEINFLPESQEREFIEAEFERAFQLGLQAAFRMRTAHDQSL